MKAKELVALLSPDVIYHAVLDLSESIVDLEDDGQTSLDRYHNALCILLTEAETTTACMS